jgi:hypothetical protein
MDPETCLLAADLRPVLLTARDASFVIGNRWLSCDACGKAVTVGEPNDVAVVNVTEATHTATARTIGALRFAVLVTDTHFQRRSPSARSLRWP